jgi:hypothetical protein
MRRRRLFRIVALPLALWFVALATDVGGVDACPMHDAMSHATSAAMPGMPGTPGMRGAPAAPSNPVPHGPVHCTCMGVCCGCAMATLPSSAVAQLPPVVVVHHARRIERTQRPLAAAVPFVLPPAIGPPALQA